VKVLGQGFQKLEHEQDRQTDTTEGITEPHWRVAKMGQSKEHLWKSQRVIGCI